MGRGVGVGAGVAVVDPGGRRHRRPLAEGGRHVLLGLARAHLDADRRRCGAGRLRGAVDVVGAVAGDPPPEHPVAASPAATRRARGLPRTGRAYQRPPSGPGRATATGASAAARTWGRTARSGGGRLQHGHQLDVLGHREQVERPQRRQASSRRRGPPPGPGRTAPARTTRRRSAGAAGRGRPGRAMTSLPAPARAGSRTTRSGRPSRRVDHGRRHAGPQRPRPGRDPAVFRPRSATAGPLRSTATTEPAGPDGPGQRHREQPGPGVEVGDPLAPARAPVPRARPGSAVAAASGAPARRRRRRPRSGRRRPRSHVVGRPQRPPLPHQADVQVGQPVETVLARVDEDHRRPPVRGGQDLELARPLPRHRGHPGLVDRRRWRSGTVRSARVSWLRCRWRPTVPSSSTAKPHPGPPPQAVRERRAPPRPPPRRSRPASRESCSATRSSFSRRWAGRATCWKSHPPHRPGPAWGHGGATRSGDASSTSTASARRNEDGLGGDPGPDPLARAGCAGRRPPARRRPGRRSRPRRRWPRRSARGRRSRHVRRSSHHARFLAPRGCTGADRPRPPGRCRSATVRWSSPRRRAAAHRPGRTTWTSTRRCTPHGPCAG